MNLCAATIKAEGARVRVILNGRLVEEMTAGRALVVGRHLMRAPAQGEGIEKRVEIRFGKRPNIYGGLVPEAIARKMGQMLVNQGHKAEEWENPERLVYENAVAIRGGLPFRLTDDPKIAAESWKESQHNRDLRRYLPPVGPESVKAVGTPSILDHGNGPKTFKVEIS